MLVPWIEKPVIGVYATCQVGTVSVLITGTNTFAMDNLSITQNPVSSYDGVSMRISLDGGETWSTMVQPIGDAGQYDTNLSWRNLGWGRSAIISVSWSSNIPTSLLGGFVDIKEGNS
jgi:hypothetical protein